MSNTHVAPPAVTAAEKATMLAGALFVAVFLAVPFMRGIAVDAVVSAAHFLADTAVNAVRAVGSVLGLA